MPRKPPTTNHMAALHFMALLFIDVDFTAITAAKAALCCMRHVGYPLLPFLTQGKMFAACSGSFVPMYGKEEVVDEV